MPFQETLSRGGLTIIEARMPDNPFKMTVDEAFPPCDPGVRPLGNKVLIQLRSPKRKSSGGIALATETQDQEKFVTTVGKVLALGGIAYHRRDDGQEWPEGAWCKPGDFVRVPKFGGDRWTIPLGEVLVQGDKVADGEARFAIYNDFDIFSQIIGDPMKFTDYVR